MASVLRPVAIGAATAPADAAVPQDGSPGVGQSGPRVNGTKRKHEQTAERPDTAGLSKFLEATDLKDLCKDEQKLVQFEHSYTVERSLRELARHNILSAPVVVSPDLDDVPSTDVEGGELSPSLLGWIDVSDILTAFLRHLEDKHATLPTQMLQLMTELNAEGPRFAQKMLVTVMGGHDRGLVYQANTRVSLLQAIRDHFLKPVDDSSRAVHRLAIFDARGSICRIISQLDVMRFLLEHVGELGGLGGASLEAAGLLEGRAPVVTVDPHMPTLLAFRAMRQAGVSGAPVVTGRGQLIANLSISDLRRIQPEHFGTLALPVAEFLALLHHTTYVGYSAGTSRQACHPFFASTASSPRTPRRSREGDSPFARSSSGFGAPPASPFGGGGGGAGSLARASWPASPGGGGGGGGGRSERLPPSPKRSAPAGGLRGESPHAMSDAGGIFQTPSQPLGIDGRRDSGGWRVPPSPRALSGGGNGTGNGLAGSPGSGEPLSLRRDSWRAGGDTGDVRLVTCTPDTSVEELLEVMVENKVHRVYVTSEGSVPQVQAVITPTDIMHLVAGAQ